MLPIETELSEFLKHCRVQHPTEGLIPVELDENQTDLLDFYEKHNRILVVKDRQVRATSTTAFYILWNTLFRPNYNVFLRSVNLQSARQALKYLKVCYVELPEHLRNIASFTTNSREHIVLSNGSKVTTVANSNYACCGELADLVVFDEAAWFKDLDDSFAASIPTLRPESGKMIVISSKKTNDPSDSFNDFTKRAETKESNFEILRIPKDSELQGTN